MKDICAGFETYSNQEITTNYKPDSNMEYDYNPTSRIDVDDYMMAPKALPSDKLNLIEVLEEVAGEFSNRI